MLVRVCLELGKVSNCLDFEVPVKYEAFVLMKQSIKLQHRLHKSPVSADTELSETLLGKS